MTFQSIVRASLRLALGFFFTVSATACKKNSAPKGACPTAAALNGLRAVGAIGNCGAGNGGENGGGENGGGNNGGGNNGGGNNGGGNNGGGNNGGGNNGGGNNGGGNNGGGNNGGGNNGGSTPFETYGADWLFQLLLLFGSNTNIQTLPSNLPIPFGPDAIPPEARQRFLIAAHGGPEHFTGVQHPAQLPAQGDQLRVNLLRGNAFVEILSINVHGNSSYRGGNSVAAGDFDGDGIPDLVAFPSTGTASPSVGSVSPSSQIQQAVILMGPRYVTQRTFYPFGNGYGRGIEGASGDLDGDGVAEIIVGGLAGSGNGVPRVKTLSHYDVNGNWRPEPLVLHRFEPYDANTRGISVASGDVNGDGFADIITGAGPNVAPTVIVFDGRPGLVALDQKPPVLLTFVAFMPEFRQGVHVAAGDVNGDGRADIIVGRGAGARSQVQVFDGSSGALLSQDVVFEPPAGQSARPSGARPAILYADTDDEQAEIAIVGGPTETPLVKVMGMDLQTVFASKMVFDASWLGGSNIAGMVW